MLKLNAGNQKVCKEKNLSSSFSADRKICPSGLLFGITRHSLVMPNSDPRVDFFYPHLTSMKDPFPLYRIGLHVRKLLCELFPFSDLGI